VGFPPAGGAGPDQITFETAEPATVAVQPGRLRVWGTRRIYAQRVQFASGLGPGVGGTFVARWLRNGTTLGSMTVLASTDAIAIAAPTNAVLADGDLLTCEVVSNAGGATGAAVLILDVA
jgi:hypothetical protein